MSYKQKCVYCGSTAHPMAYKTTYENERVFNCIGDRECLRRVRAKLMAKDAELFELELRNFVLFVTHRSGGDKQNHLPYTTTPAQIYKDIETFMREVYQQ